MSAPPGWYPDPQDHRQEFLWDGARWIGSRTRASARRGGGIWLALGLTAAALVVIASLTVAAVVVGVSMSMSGGPSTPRPAVSDDSAAPTPATTAEAPSGPKAPRQSEAEKPREPTASEKLEADGFREVEDGIFAKWADRDQYSCEYWRCSMVLVVTLDGCPTALYAEAAIMSSETQIGMTNELTTTLAPLEQAALTFRDHTGDGDSFKLTKTSCY